jgi:hypothetical protein
MKRTNYITPSVDTIELNAEGVLCASPGQDDDSLKLPGVNWNDETEW